VVPDIIETVEGAPFRWIQMTNIQVSGTVRRGLARKPYSAGLGMLLLVSMTISALSASLLASDFLGYHAPSRAPHPIVSILILLSGLAIAAVGQILGAGRNLGIRTRGWLGVIDAVHIHLVLASIVFVGCVLKYTVAGKQIHLYPVGLLTIVCVFLLASRPLTKYVFNLDHRKRLKGSTAS
jgi:hypothetical protein